MKFEINRLELLAAAKNVAKVAPARSPVEVLNGILVESDDSTSDVFLTATNFEVSIQQKVRGSVGEGGSMLINSRLLVSMLSLLSGEFVTFSAERPDVIKVSGGSCVYEIVCLPAKHYPKPVMPFPEETVRLSGICSLAKRTVFATSDDEKKPVYQCVYVKLKRNAIQAAACDSFRMMLVKSEAESNDTYEFLLPSRSLQLLASISTDSDVFEVADMGKEIVFVRENILFTTKKVVGDFMDINMVIKSIVPVYTAITNAEEVESALDLIAVGAGNQPVKVAFSKDYINLSCNGEIGASQTSIAANVLKDTPSSGFYYDIYNLLKLFKIMSGKVKIEIDNKGMMLVKSRNEVYLQLPRMNRQVVPESKKKIAA